MVVPTSRAGENLFACSADGAVVGISFATGELGVPITVNEKVVDFHPCA